MVVVTLAMDGDAMVIDRDPMMIDAVTLTMQGRTFEIDRDPTAMEAMALAMYEDAMVRIAPRRLQTVEAIGLIKAIKLIPTGLTQRLSETDFLDVI